MKNEFEMHVKIVQAFVNFRLASVDNEQKRWWRENNKTYGKSKRGKSKTKQTKTFARHVVK